MQFNLTDGVTPVSHDIYSLHMTVLAVCAGIGIIVFGTIIYSIIHHRKSKGVKAAKFHEHLWIELTWTIIPFIILVALAVPSTQVLRNINHNGEQTDLTIVITAYQWKWKYEYLNRGISFFSSLSTPFDQLSGKTKKNLNYLREVDQPLVVPIHKKIHFLITSNDVIHSWWVPELGVKRDAVPGFINESWARINRAGVYHGQCAELCGVNHAFMPIVVIAMSEKGFTEWLAQQATGMPKQIKSTTTAPPAMPLVSQKTKPPPAKEITAPTLSLEQLLTKGKTVYLNTCAACHKPDGSGMPPVFPNLITSPIAKGPAAKHIHMVVFGVPGTAMQAFGQQLSPEDIAAVITYERDEIAHHKNEIIQPADIIAAEKGLKP